jgi:hypothetical protein
MPSTVFVSPAYKACVHAGLRDAERAFEWLDRAHAERSGGLAYLHVDPQFAWLHGDPRFANLVARVSIAQL